MPEGAVPDATGTEGRRILFFLSLLLTGIPSLDKVSIALEALQKPQFVVRQRGRDSRKLA
jgi:hypothetical protein